MKEIDILINLQINPCMRQLEANSLVLAFQLKTYELYAEQSE